MRSYRSTSRYSMPSTARASTFAVGIPIAAASFIQSASLATTPSNRSPPGFKIWVLVAPPRGSEISSPSTRTATLSCAPASERRIPSSPASSGRFSMRRVGCKGRVRPHCPSRCRCAKSASQRNECRGYFGGILPEESKREIIARNLGISARNDYAMLEQIGGECAGAVTFVPTGEALPESDYHYRTLSSEELAAVLRELPKEIGARTLVAARAQIRFSCIGGWLMSM